ncbi:MAG: tetratricopeptide repeat protein [Planctomycetota bacterium]|jgi:tetratricopeptide (TPR) repeat protein
MKSVTIVNRPVLMLAAAVLLVPLVGCGPSFRELRMEGLQVMLEKQYAPARYIFIQADEVKRNQVDNLHDMGFCSVMIARDRVRQGDKVGALQDLDRAVEYYTRAIDAHPGHQSSLIGKNVALELRGEPEAALDHAKWAVRVVGPSARQYLFLADELDQRGDADGALLRYRQAVSIEPDNARAHASFAKFLLRHNNESAAIGHLRYAFKLNPQDAWVREQLASRDALPSPPPPKAE